MKTKMVWTLIALFSIVSNTGCFDFMDSNEELDYSKRMIIKSIKVDSCTIEWYHYSLISGYSLSYVDLIDDKQKKNLCKSPYVSDISIKDNILTIKLWKNDFDYLDLERKGNLLIEKDTTGIQPVF